MNQIFHQLKMKQHLDKTFIGRISRGFDFLGYHFSTETLQLAKVTVRKHVERYCRLYEQLQRKKANPKEGVNDFFVGNTKKANSNELAFRLEQYVIRWLCCCTSGLGINGITFSSYDVINLDRRYLSP